MQSLANAVSMLALNLERLSGHVSRPMLVYLEKDCPR